MKVELVQNILFKENQTPKTGFNDNPNKETYREYPYVYIYKFTNNQYLQILLSEDDLETVRLSYREYFGVGTSAEIYCVASNTCFEICRIIDKQFEKCTLSEQKILTTIIVEIDKYKNSIIDKITK